MFGINTYQYVGGYSAAIYGKLIHMTDVNGIHQIFRDMQNPHSKGDPNTYLTDAFWFDTTATAYDYGGVHRNSGVQNYMYYLLVTGGSGTNANGLAYSISGIGFAQARLIAYQGLTVGYLNATFNHVEARDAWVHAVVIYTEIVAHKVKRLARHGRPLALGVIGTMVIIYVELKQVM
ncbi:MAG: M4 family metallopeptidase [Bacteroidetes bacterium]|nr:M4 family metallopeptidase [Bacteroidota bacterium]